MSKTDKEIKDLNFYVIAGISVCLFVIAVLSIVTMLMDQDYRNACDSVGGRYEVIRSEYSEPLQQMVEVYGCVKVSD